MIPGAVLIIPPFVSIYRTGQRIERMEGKAGRPNSLEPILGLVLAFFYSLHLPYYQSHLNGAWTSAQTRAAAIPSPPPGPPAIPPPPPQG